VGDTVLVASGIYEVKHIRLKDGVILKSENGPLSTKLFPDLSEWPQPGSAIDGVDLHMLETEINGFWVEGFIWGSGISLGYCDIRVLNNILVGNDIGLYMNLTSRIRLENNTFYGNVEYGIEATDGSEAGVLYNIIWDRARGLDLSIMYWNDFMNISDAWPHGSDNFSQDPEFCGGEAGNFYLQSDSPCAPGNSPWPPVGLIGALPVGCGTTGVEHKTWGHIKAMYRE
jgi:parallel beta-helix repeat protein